MSKTDKQAGGNTGAQNTGAPESPEEIAAKVQAQLDEGANKGGAQPRTGANVGARNAPEETSRAVAAPQGKYFVSAGKSITSKKGILGPHTEVKPEYLGMPSEEAARAHLKKLQDKGVLYFAEKVRPAQVGDSQVKSDVVVAKRTLKTSRSPRNQ